MDYVVEKLLDPRWVSSAAMRELFSRARTSGALEAEHESKTLGRVGQVDSTLYFSAFLLVAE